MKQTILALITILLSTQLAIANTHYKLNAKQDAILGAGIIATVVPSFFIDRSPSDSPVKYNINAFDRSTMMPYNQARDDLGTAATYMALILPGVIVLDRMKEFDLLFTYGVMYAEAFTLSLAAKDLLKSTIPRYRPHTYFETSSRNSSDDASSFPSGHTTFAFMSAAFLATTFSTDYPESRWKRPLIASSYTLATAIGISRITSGKHFASDVLAGAVIGSLSGYFIPKLHLHEHASLAIMPLGSGVSISFSLIQ